MMIWRAVHRDTEYEDMVRAIRRAEWKDVVRCSSEIRNAAKIICAVARHTRRIAREATRRPGQVLDAR